MPESGSQTPTATLEEVGADSPEPVGAKELLIARGCSSRIVRRSAATVFGVGVPIDAAPSQLHSPLSSLDSSAWSLPAANVLHEVKGGRAQVGRPSAQVGCATLRTCCRHDDARIAERSIARYSRGFS